MSRTKREIARMEPIHEPTGKMHCMTCFGLGTHVARRYAIIQWEGEPNIQIYTFPCATSQGEFAFQARRLGKVLEQGVIRDSA